MPRKRTPSGQQRMLKKIQKLHSITRYAARKIFWNKHVKQRQSCKMANFKQIQEQATEKMRPVVEFFVGDLDKFKPIYRSLMKNRITNANHPCMRPWPYEAYLAFRNGHRITQLSKLRNIAICQQTIYFKCALYKKPTDRKVKLPLGAVMKLAMGCVSLDSWLKYCAHPGHRSGHDYSHLHGLN